MEMWFIVCMMLFLIILLNIAYLVWKRENVSGRILQSAHVIGQYSRRDQELLLNFKKKEKR